MSHLRLLCGRHVAVCSLRGVLGHLALVAFLIFRGSLHREREGQRGTRVRLLLSTVHTAAFCASEAAALVACVRTSLLEFGLRLIGEVRRHLADLLSNLSELHVRIRSLHLIALCVAEREKEAGTTTYASAHQRTP